MERMTKPLASGEFCLADLEKVIHTAQGYSGEAITRLGLFESAYENLIGDQARISAELEKLRNEGKKNSVKFRELMGKKLVSSNTMAIFKLYGLE
ncbi:MAG: hypothetical protein RR461_03340 [Angelakisella sp.]